MVDRLIMLSLGPIVFLGKLLVSEKFGVHAFGAHVLASLCLFDAVGMRLLRVVVSASVLLLWVQTRAKQQDR